jgi:hypothetical protein
LLEEKTKPWADEWVTAGEMELATGGEFVVGKALGRGVKDDSKAEVGVRFDGGCGNMDRIC